MLRIHRFTTAAVAIALLATAPAMAQTQDLRSPDAAAAGQPQSPPVQDLRTPDAIDPMVPTPVEAPARVRIVEVPSTGFGWGDAGIGAAGMLAIVTLGVGVAMTAAHHRRGRRFTTTPR